MAVGDQDGVVQMFSMKKDEPIIHFKTLPAEKIQSIQLSGTPGNKNKQTIIHSKDNPFKL